MKKDSSRCRRLKTGLTLLALGLVLMALVQPAPARAQFAVFDGANFGQNALTALRAAEAILQRIQMIQHQLTQIEHMLRNLAQIEEPVFTRILRHLFQVLRVMERETKGLIYSQRLASIQFQRIYRWEPAEHDLLEEDRKRVETSIETARAALLATKLQGEDLLRAQSRLEELKDQALDAEGNLQALEALALLEAHTAQEIGKLTQQMLIQTNLTSVAVAHALASPSAAEETFREVVEASRRDVPSYGSVPPIPVVPETYQRSR